MTTTTSAAAAAGELTIEQLADYYLSCLTYERRPEVSAWARSKFALEYIELPANPINGDELFARDVPAATRLEGIVHKDRSKELYVGYLTFLRVFESQKGRTTYRVYPLIVRPARNPELPAAFNPEALKYLLGLGAGGGLPAEELVDLEDAVGLSRLNLDVSLEGVCTRLKEERSDWNWVEEPTPTGLVTPESRSHDPSGIPSLADANKPGIYNRAILLVGEAQKFTVGLESELAQLRKMDRAVVKSTRTAIVDWISDGFQETQPQGSSTASSSTTDTNASARADAGLLLEPLPLNAEQREAVHKALTQDLTVITGPPGTGKSQVVSSILLNAAFRGTSVLFASKNNKAVDVVEERVNALGPRPVLLRLGSRDHQSQLSEYLSSLLGMRSTPSDQDQYADAVRRHKNLGEQLDRLDTQLEDLVLARNGVDELERSAEEARDILPDGAFASSAEVDLDSMKVRSSLLAVAAHRADRERQGWLIRLAWPLLRKRRVANLKHATDEAGDELKLLGLDPPEVSALEDPGAWVTLGERATESVNALPAAAKYLSALAELTALPPTTDLSRERQALLGRIAANSQQVWRSWLRIQPSLLTPAGRKLLGLYQGALNIAAGGGRRGAAAQVTQLFPEVSKHLSCWGITSLSARGRIPLEPGFFDLLVIDEASQCDIASALPLLYRAKRVVIIGDPMQLRHVSSLDSARDEQLLERASMLGHLDWSYSARSLFDLASSMGSPEDLVTLRDHHRSHADIIGFSNQQFYGGQLRVATRYETLKGDRGPAVRWIQVSGNVQRQTGGSVYNPAEVEAVVTELERLADQGYRGSVGAVSPFRPQANRIRDAAYARDSITRFLNDADFQVGTAHSFQGDERDLMIFSPVVAQGISNGSLRFLNSNANLFNVAITRARAALIVVGDAAAEEVGNVSYLAAFRDYAMSPERESSALEEVVAADHGSTYPRVSHPDQVSEWERLFYEALYKAGIATSPQVPVESYRLDLALTDGPRKLDIEVDGDHYHRAWNGEIARRDQLRNQRLIELGWDVMRFWVYQVRDDLDGSISRVRTWVEDSR